MAKFSNIVIVSDMDGTFLASKSRIVPENMKAIEYFRQNGGKFTFVTGRNHPAVASLDGAVDAVNAPIGFHNGCYLFDTQKQEIFDEICIVPKAVNDVTEYLLTLPESIDFTFRCAFSFLKIDGRSSGDFDIFAKRWPERCFALTVDEATKRSVNKIVFSGNTEKIASVREYIENTFSDTVECTSAGSGYIEIMPKGVKKSIVIPHLRKLEGLENAKFFAIGDYENDIDMIKTADFGACPDNAMDKVKEVAQIHVCHHDKGAVADLIRIIEEKYIG
ncbi:MAG: Cof-type HAD-IIB family hydrolase [Ruminococcaceae bacterium]|nr:Cof-type HAD-IIB family hydrolase [Oscillospiraceae bacterium]